MLTPFYTALATTFSHQQKNTFFYDRTASTATFSVTI
ncbi:Uncharacterised protein [Providencia rettgeri]|nr:hypothetical protein RB151_016710 [Providencia rettgeri]CAB5597403.1 Uncharacterised protein [Providencia rettgeri]CAC9179154.1 Uncharacterised protein [Providencia rettgeri]CAD0188055.1 Hypothetical_protein [Providencia rettgeri]